MKNDQIVITSRVRLARNLKNYRFPTIMDQDEANKVILEVDRAVNSNNLDYNLTYLKDISKEKTNELVEKHIISPDLANKSDRAAFLLSSDNKVSILLNEEDHIRIQTIDEGFSLNECWNRANKIDDVIENSVDYSFDLGLGYITSCPTNIGTGMRASVMLHLPALSITNQVDKLLYSVTQLGVAVRGVYGEGTKSLGHLYQVSNQGTLGKSEEALIDRIAQLVVQIENKEKLSREYLIKNKFSEIEDEVYRSYGLLTNARNMSTDEAMKLLSLLKLGKEMGIIDLVNHTDIYSLMLKIQPNTLSSLYSEEMDVVNRDKKRAELIRNELTQN